MSPHETFIQYIKIILGIIALTFCMHWCNRVIKVLEEQEATAVQNLEISTQMINLYKPK